MGRWTDWFSVTDDEAARFVRAYDSGGNEAVMEVLRPYIEGGSDLAMDKLWEPIHRILTGDYAPAHVLNFTAGEYPLKLVVLGGAYLLDEPSTRSLQYACSDEVPDVAAALTALSPDWLRERFFAMPPNQYLPLTEDWFDEVSQHVQMLTGFYCKAAAKGHAAFCAIDH